jgi:threonine synthase
VPVIRCTKCGLEYPQKGIPFVCCRCNNVFDFSGPFSFTRTNDSSVPGIWKWGIQKNFDAKLPIVSLGEGDTPLAWISFQGKRIGMKCEYLNPTGSFKDRGSCVLTSYLLGQGVQNAVEDSSGNAGASFAAFAARAGIHVSVFIPTSASGPKKMQIQKTGAEVIQIPGSREAVVKAVREKVKLGMAYASHAYLPFGLCGIATMAYEILEQVGKMPGTVIAPVGHGSLLLGIIRGFSALVNSNPSLKSPFYIGVQSEAYSPIVKAFRNGKGEVENACSDTKTIAEGIQITTPVRGATLLYEISDKKGSFLSIGEELILRDDLELAKMGFLVEPTSALVWSACKEKMQELAEPIILILSGSGLKYKDTLS